MDLTVAYTIRKQLGGRRFDVMTGAKDFSYDQQAKTLKFRLPKMAGNKVTAVQVQLLDNDTYRMIFWDLRFGAKFHMYEVANIEGVYAEDLQAVFTEQTGLYTSLGTMGRG